MEGKQKFASQIMTSKSPVRSAEDIDETALSYAEIIADLSREKHSRNLFRHRNLREVQMMNRLSDEWFSSKSESVPLWHKIALSIDTQLEIDHIDQ